MNAPTYYHPQQQPPRKRRWPLILIAALVAIVFFACLGTIIASKIPVSDKAHPVFVQPTSAPPTSPPKPKVKDAKPKPNTSIGEGTWEVGKDIQAGQWKTVGAQDSQVPMCYWDVRKDNENGEILAQGVKNSPDAQGVVTLKNGQWFTTSGCQEWKRSAEVQNLTWSWGSVPLTQKKVYVINRLPSSWPTASAESWIDQYTGSDWVMASSCPASAYRCITVVRDDSLHAPVIGATYCYDCSRVTIKIDVAYANSRGNTTWTKRKYILAHEFGHAGEIHDHSSSCGNLMYAHTGCYGFALTSVQKRILAAH